MENENPHPNINLIYRLRRALRVHLLAVQFLNLRQSINQNVQNGQLVTQQQRDQLAALRADAPFFVENIHPDGVSLLSSLLLLDVAAIGGLLFATCVEGRSDRMLWPWIVLHQLAPGDAHWASVPP
ncbi:hypothetical protein MTO96_049582 [Rhipicephalus appendiculatus]